MVWVRWVDLIMQCESHRLTITGWLFCIFARVELSLLSLSPSCNARWPIYLKILTKQLIISFITLVNLILNFLYVNYNWLHINYLLKLKYSRELRHRKIKRQIKDGDPARESTKNIGQFWEIDNRLSIHIDFAFQQSIFFFVF